MFSESVKNCSSPFCYSFDFPAAPPDDLCIKRVTTGGWIHMRYSSTTVSISHQPMWTCIGTQAELRNLENHLPRRSSHS